ncbi:MAG: glycerol acyltransferase [bacterium]|nr:glycerol acyltransferase [bacterium]
MHRTAIDTPVLNHVLPFLGRLFLVLFRWRPEGQLPDAPKCVLIAAPHTSNWDFMFTLAIAFVFRAKVFWLGKDALFRWPFGGLMRWLGGISVDRGRGHNVARQVMRAFEENEELCILIPPEGTRSKVSVWKKGFYHIAKGADVPIGLGFLDYKRRRGGFGPVVVPSDDIEADMRQIREFYSGVTGRHPAKTGEITL